MCIMHQRQPSAELFPALYSLQSPWTFPAMLTERGASGPFQAEPACCVGEWIVRMPDILVPCYPWPCLGAAVANTKRRI